MTAVLTIGYGREVFDERSNDRARLRACAVAVGELHMVVFSKEEHGCRAAADPPLFLYPTQSRSRVGMLIDAHRLASAVLGSRGVAKGGWIVSAQDPFDAGLVGYLLHLHYGVPLQIQEHGDFFGSTWWRRERLLNRLRYVFGKWLLRRADCVRTVSKRAREHLCAIGVDAAKITTLAVVSDTRAFTSDTSVADSSNLRMQYPGAEVVVLTVGRLVKEKNIPLLIKAFGSVASRHPTARLVIVGSGPEEKHLRALAENHGFAARISFVPWTRDVASYMKSADIFALSSYREGWARVIVEAMAAGLPGVVTDVGCVGEAFLDERHGIVVPVADEAAFAQALERLAVDVRLRNSYGAAAREAHTRQSVSLEAYAASWTAACRTCLKSHRNPKSGKI